LTEAPCSLQASSSVPTGLLLVVLVLEPGRPPGCRDLLSMAGVGLVGVGMNNVAFTLG